MAQMEGASGIGSKDPNSQATANGIAEPSAAPMSAPISATIANSTSARPTTPDPVAPIAFRMASVARLRSTKPCAAFATPTPPTTSDNSPASVRNSAKRSRSLTEVWGDVEARAGIPSGLRESPLGLSHQRLDGGIVRRLPRTAHDDSRRPSDQRARLHQLCRVKSRLRHEHARPKPNPCRQPIGFADEDGAKGETRFADANDVAELQVEASQQRLFHRRPEHAVFFAKRVVERHGRREDRRAEARP